MHGLPVSCPFNFPNGNLKQQLSHIGVFICYQNIDAKNKLNLHIYGTHLLNPYKTVVSHLKQDHLSPTHYSVTNISEQALEIETSVPPTNKLIESISNSVHYSVQKENCA